MTNKEIKSLLETTYNGTKFSVKITNSNSVIALTQYNKNIFKSDESIQDFINNRTYLEQSTEKYKASVIKGYNNFTNHAPSNRIFIQEIVDMMTDIQTIAKNEFIDTITIGDYNKSLIIK